ncbi:MAG: VCBS repeat-containing protein [Opitutaceae bacterium]|nr:VCBS repeat-containing protein [Opitutaceae bacterium]
MLSPFFRPRFLVLMLALLGAAEAAADVAGVAAQLARSAERYRTPEDWTRRREELREGFLQAAGLWPLPARTPLNPIVHSRREYDGYSVENVALETFPGFWCTGNLYRPLNRREPGPAILCPHGHFQPLGRFRDEHQIRCAQLARMGATVFSYAMVGWQDSRQVEEHKDPLSLSLQTWNSIRVVDFLAGLPDVDPRRIGATGASGGGSQSFYLAMLDDRIAACAPVAIVYPWAAPEGCACEGGLPVMAAAGTNAIELVAAIAPRPLLVVTDGGDATRDFPAVGLPFVREVYRRLGNAAGLEHVHLPHEGHDYGPSKRAAAYRFFAREFGLPLLPEEADRITLEPPEALEVFNERRPLPVGSLKGRAAVARTFATLLRPVPAGMDADEARVAGLRQAPHAEFTEHLLMDKYAFPYGLAAADLDGDGDQDLISPDGGLPEWYSAAFTAAHNNLYWFENFGAGAFLRHYIRKNEPERLERMAVGDINGDRTPDVVIVENKFGSIFWFANSGRPAQDAEWSRHVIADRTLANAYDVALGDLDGDGDLDVAAATHWTNAIVWYENPGPAAAGAGPWRQHQVDADLKESRTIRAADLDRDGDVDLLATGTEAGLVVWYENRGAGQWRRHLVAETSRPMHGDVVDMDDDGDLDILMAAGMESRATPPGEVVWYENVRAKDGAAWPRHVIAAEFQQGFEAVAGDLDGDGDKDVAATAFGPKGRLVWFENPGDPQGKWIPRLLKDRWQNANQVIITDVDGDRLPDIAAAAARGSLEVRWWRNEAR